ncbi:Rv1733c family protein [Streptomyces sp. NPDC054797]
MRRMKPEPSLENSPLRRPSDRTRSRCRAALVLSSMAAIACGVLAGLAVWDADSRTAQEQAQHMHRTTATTVGEAEPGFSPRTEGRTEGRAEGRAEAVAQAVWQYPAATGHTGKVAVPPQTPAGRSVTVWVDDAGAAVPAPRSGGDRGISSAFAGVSVACVIALSAGAVVHLRLRLVEANNLAEWEFGWERVEPQWSGRLRSEPGPDDD